MVTNNFTGHTLNNSYWFEICSMTLGETLFEIEANNIGKGIQGDLGALGVLELVLGAFP